MATNPLLRFNNNLSSLAGVASEKLVRLNDTTLKVKKVLFNENQEEVTIYEEQISLTEIDKSIAKIDAQIAECSAPGYLEAVLKALSDQKEKLESMKNIINNP